MLITEHADRSAAQRRVAAGVANGYLGLTSFDLQLVFSLRNN